MFVNQEEDDYKVEGEVEGYLEGHHVSWKLWVDPIMVSHFLL